MQDGWMSPNIERNQATEPGKQLLHSLARIGTGKASLGHLEAELSPAIEVASTLKLLVRRELLELVNGEYRFQVNLVRRWFAQDHFSVGVRLETSA